METHHTGLFITFEKSMMLLRFVRSVLYTDFNVLVVCGPKKANSACELILQNISNKINPNFSGAKDLLVKYIQILECSCTAPCPSTTSKLPTNSKSLDPQSSHNQSKVDGINKNVEPTTENVQNLEVIDLVHEESLCNETASDIIVVDDTATSKLRDLKDISDVLTGNELYYIDKSLSSFENPKSCTKNTSKRKPKKKYILNKKLKCKKQNTIICLTKNKNVLKDNNRSVNDKNYCKILNNNESKAATESLVSQNSVIDTTIDLINDGSDGDDDLIIVEQSDDEVIVIDSPASKEHLQVVVHQTGTEISQESKKAFHSLKRAKKLRDKSEKKKAKLIKSIKNKYHKTSLINNVLAKINSPETKLKNKKCFETWSRPGHMSPALTRKPPGVSTVSSGSNVGSNIYNPNENEKNQAGLRPIVIDGSNLAIGHGKGVFSVRGLQICVDYFMQRGHKNIKVFVPQFRVNSCNFEELNRMEKSGILVYTPSRRINGKMVVPYDDRFIIQYAAATDGVIVSSDNYRDLYDENPAWRETIQNRLLMFTWVDDLLMFPQDPLGRNGPTLDQFLRY